MRLQMRSSVSSEKAGHMNEVLCMDWLNRRVFTPTTEYSVLRPAVPEFSVCTAQQIQYSWASWFSAPDTSTSRNPIADVRGSTITDFGKSAAYAAVATGAMR